MGAVWLAEDSRLHRQVALKMVRAADTGGVAARERLMREARAAAALNHAHIATVHDVIEADAQVIIVLEYVEGETLHARLKRGPLPLPEAVDIALQIAKALAAAHAHGVVHRDLKPANVIIGDGGHAKVLDFGLARVLGLGTTHTGGHAAETAGIAGAGGRGQICGQPASLRTTGAQAGGDSPDMCYAVALRPPMRYSARPARRLLTRPVLDGPTSRASTHPAV